jgi:hypothetical protein
MVAYTGIQGQNILITASDPSNPTEGQIWYNTTSNLLKGYANVVTNTWASGGNLNTGRQSAGSSGIQTAASFYGGFSTAATGLSESYNGSAWSGIPSLNTARYDGGSLGTASAALYFGGNPGGGTSTDTEEYDGSSWTTSGNLPVSINAIRGSGTQTAGLAFGGGPSPVSSATITYNGSTWTSVPATLNTARYGMAQAGGGTQTAAITFGGYTGTVYSGATELYNGTSWTSSPATMNNGRVYLAGAGSQTSAVGAGGETAPNFQNFTELFNGTSWTSSTNLPTATNNIAGCGTQASALVGGGYAGSPTRTAATFEWTGSSIQVRTITTS